MRVAYYSPLPPERSGIADYSALLLPALRERIEVVLPRRRSRRSPRGVDLALYHVGNDPQAHGWIVEALRRRPGVVMLHDFVLHHLVAGMTLGRGDGEGYLSAMHREAGVVGRLLAHGVVDGLVPPLWETKAEEFPLAHPVLDHATGLLVHSRYVEERVREYGYARPIRRVPHPAWPPPALVAPAALPRKARPLIGCFGNITPSKRIPQLLEAYARLRQRFPEALLVLAGPLSPRYDLDVALESLDLRRGEDVLDLGYVDEGRLWSLIAASDICVNLRWPTMGETSGAAIRALTIGRPLVVSDVGWFAELPDDAVAKVPVDELEVPMLATVLERLAGDAALRERLGAAAAEYVRREHDVGRVAEAYAAALEEAAGGGWVREAVLGEVAQAAADVGIGPQSMELAEVSTALREGGLGG